MKILLLSIVWFIALFGCQRQPIKTDGIKFIKISSIQKRLNDNDDIVRNKKQIDQITKILKGASKEPIKFIAEYEIDLVYKDGLICTLLVRNNYLNIQGYTYRLKENLGEKIELIRESLNN